MTEVNEDEFAPTSWGNFAKFRKPFTFVTPSGQKCLLQRLDISDIMDLGLGAELDFLSKMLSKVSAGGEENVGSGVLTNMGSGDNFSKMNKTLHLVLNRAILKPSVALPLTEGAERKEGVIYLDQFPFFEKMTIFGQVLNFGAAESFREGSPDDVGNLADDANVPLPAEPIVEPAGGLTGGVLPEPSDMVVR